MSGALNSVLGGSGSGGLLGIVGGIVGEVMGGPIGEMIGQAVGNMLQQAIGDSVKDASKQLSQEDGMPSFLQSLISDKVDQAVGSIQNNDVTPEAQQTAQDQYGGAVQNFQQELTKSLVDNTRQYMESAQDSASTGSGGATGQRAGKYGGNSWLEAIAKAMGEVLGDKAAKLVGLSNDISRVANAGGDDQQQEQAAKQMSALQSEMQGTSQMFSLLQNAFTNAIKSIGEGLAGLARKS